MRIFNHFAFAFSFITATRILEVEQHSSGNDPLQILSILGDHFHRTIEHEKLKLIRKGKYSRRWKAKNSKNEYRMVRSFNRCGVSYFESFLLDGNVAVDINKSDPCEGLNVIFDGYNKWVENNISVSKGMVQAAKPGEVQAVS